MTVTFACRCKSDNDCLAAKAMKMITSLSSHQKLKYCDITKRQEYYMFTFLKMFTVCLAIAC